MVAQAQAQFGIIIAAEDSGVDSAVNQLEKLKSTLEDDEDQLKNVNKALRALSSAGLKNSAEAGAMIKDRVRLQTELANNTKKFYALGGAQVYTRKQAKAVADQEKKQSKELDKIQKHKEDQEKRNMSLAEKQKEEILNRNKKIIDGLKNGFFGADGPIKQVVSRLAALAAPSVIAGLTAFAAKMSDSRRASQLFLEAQGKIQHMFFNTKTSGKDLSTIIDDLSNSYGVSAEKAQQMVLANKALGYAGGKLQSISRAQATVFMAMNQNEEATTYEMQRLRWQALLTGKSLEKMAKDKWGPLAKQQAIGLGNQLTKLKENISKLFSTVPMEKFLSGLKEVTDKFSQTSYIGFKLKEMISRIFNLDSDMSWVDVFKNGIDLATLKLLELENRWYELQIAFIESTGISNFEDLRKSLKSLEPILIGVGVAAGIYAAGMLWGAISTLAVPLAIVAVVASLIWLYDKFLELVPVMQKWWDDFLEAGSNICKGIVEGIKSGWESVVKWVKDLGSAIINIFAKETDQHSPSKKFKKMGINLTTGLTQGIIEGKRKSLAEMRRLAADIDAIPVPFSPSDPTLFSEDPDINPISRKVRKPSTTGSAHVKHSESTSGSGGRYGDIIFNIQGSNAKAIAEEVRETLIGVFNEMRIQIGAGPHSGPKFSSE